MTYFLVQRFLKVRVRVGGLGSYALARIIFLEEKKNGGNRGIELLLAFSIFLEKKEKRIFLPKKCIVFEEKCVFFGITVDFPQGIKTIFVFYFFFMKIETANSNSIPPLSLTPKRTYFSWKTMHFFWQKNPFFFVFSRKLRGPTTTLCLPFFLAKKLLETFFLIVGKQKLKPILNAGI